VERLDADGFRNTGEVRFQAPYSTQRGRVFVIQGFEYILIVGTPKTVSKNIKSANAERFFKSFSIIP
jgi:hypothetical protein